MTIYLSVCLFVCLLAGLHNTTGCNFMKKSEDGSWSNLNPIKFENDLDHHLNTKKKQSGHSYLLIVST